MKTVMNQIQRKFLKASKLIILNAPKIKIFEETRGVF